MVPVMVQIILAVSSCMPIAYCIYNHPQRIQYRLSINSLWFLFSRPTSSAVERPRTPLNNAKVGNLGNDLKGSFDASLVDFGIPMTPSCNRIKHALSAFLFCRNRYRSESN